LVVVALVLVLLLVLLLFLLANHTFISLWLMRCVCGIAR
jgi:hypothetical protein